MGCRTSVSGEEPCDCELRRAQAVREPPGESVKYAGTTPRNPRECTGALTVELGRKYEAAFRRLSPSNRIAVLPKTLNDSRRRHKAMRVLTYAKACTRDSELLPQVSAIEIGKPWFRSDDHGLRLCSQPCPFRPDMPELFRPCIRRRPGTSVPGPYVTPDVVSREHYCGNGHCRRAPWAAVRGQCTTHVRSRYTISEPIGRGRVPHGSSRGT